MVMNGAFLRDGMAADEKVIWEGKPDKKAFFLKAVFNFLLPISIVWGILDFSLLFSSVSGDEGAENLIIVPFMLLHLMPVWIYLASVVLAFFRYRNTAYLLTDKNIYISGGVFAREVNVKPLSRLYELQTKVGLFEKLCHVGSVIIGDPGVGTAETGQIVSAVGIQSVPDYDELCRRIRSLQFNAASDMCYPNDKR